MPARRVSWPLCSELTMGMLSRRFFSCGLSSVPRSPIRNRKLRRRIWTSSPSLASSDCDPGRRRAFHVWKYFLWLYLTPGVVGREHAKLRKYVEHVGLTGSTVNSSTRSIVGGGLGGHVR
jgi:hypothetical protein